MKPTRIGIQCQTNRRQGEIWECLNSPITVTVNGEAAEVLAGRRVSERGERLPGQFSDAHRRGKGSSQCPGDRRVDPGSGSKHNIQ
jgi:hypothetical protein